MAHGQAKHLLEAQGATPLAQLVAMRHHHRFLLARAYPVSSALHTFITINVISIVLLKDIVS